MNYLDHYTKLVDRAKNRSLDVYAERHHIVPICIGGTNDASNLVKLLPEEHYVAHQLLVKMYPNNSKLVNAAAMMCVVGINQPGRSKNKLFGWLRRRLSLTNSISGRGELSSQFGTVWVYNIESGISRKIKKKEILEYISVGWIKGRNLKKLSCKFCGKEFITSKLSIKSCSKECQHQIRSLSAQNQATCRAVIDDNNNKFNSLSAAARHHNLNVETIRYRIKTGKYRWDESVG